MSSTNLLRKSDHTEKPMQASKWLAQPMLIDVAEMNGLLNTLGDFFIFLTSCITEEGKSNVTKEQFLKVYSHYIEELKQGKIPDENGFRHYFSSIFTVSTDHVYAITLENDQQLIRVSKPVVQLQGHKIGFSKADEKFRSRSFGGDSISWGIQFSYPQLYQNPTTQEIFQVKKGKEFPNTELFQRIQRWTRDNTVPTPFIVNEKQINVPMRLGKQCFSWINQHPQLLDTGISVLTSV